MIAVGATTEVVTEEIGEGMMVVVTDEEVTTTITEVVTAEGTTTTVVVVMGGTMEVEEVATRIRAVEDSMEAAAAAVVEEIIRVASVEEITTTMAGTLEEAAIAITEDNNNSTKVAAVETIMAVAAIEGETTTITVKVGILVLVVENRITLTTKIVKNTMGEATNSNKTNTTKGAINNNLNLVITRTNSMMIDVDPTTSPIITTAESTLNSSNIEAHIKAIVEIAVAPTKAKVMVMTSRMAGTSSTSSMEIPSNRMVGMAAIKEGRSTAILSMGVTREAQVIKASVVNEVEAETVSKAEKLAELELGKLISHTHMLCYSIDINAHYTHTN